MTTNNRSNKKPTSSKEEISDTMKQQISGEDLISHTINKEETSKSQEEIKKKNKNLPHSNQNNNE